MDATPLEKMGFGEGATEKAQKAFANDRDGVKNSELCSALVASFLRLSIPGLCQRSALACLRCARNQRASSSLACTSLSGQYRQRRGEEGTDHYFWAREKAQRLGLYCAGANMGDGRRCSGGSLALSAHSWPTFINAALSETKDIRGNQRGQSRCREGGTGGA